MALYDRGYMQAPSGSNRHNPLLWLLGLLAGFYFLQIALSMTLGGEPLVLLLGLTDFNLLRGFFWTPLTYALLHADPWHLLFNCLFIFMFGRALLPDLGSARFIRLTVFSALLGGLTFILFHIGGPFAVVGASGIAMAFLTVFCLQKPFESITLFVFFLFPLELQRRYLLIGTLVLQLAFFGSELMGRPAFAASAHLGGMLAGYLFHRKIVMDRPLFGSFFASRRPMQRVGVERRRGARSSQPRYRVNIGNRVDLRGEVDRILDKINSQGFGSLTPEEKRLLDKARDILSK